jgi:hypothetical protein
MALRNFIQDSLLKALSKTVAYLRRTPQSSADRIGPNYFWFCTAPLVLAITYPSFFLFTNHLILFANDFHCDPWDYIGLFYLVDHPQVLNPETSIPSRHSDGIDRKIPKLT